MADIPNLLNKNRINKRIVLDTKILNDAKNLLFNIRFLILIFNHISIYLLTDYNG